MATELGDLLLQARMMRKWTLREVARRTGIHNSHISQIETGRIEKPGPQHLWALAQVYEELDYSGLMRLAGHEQTYTGLPPLTISCETCLGSGVIGSPEATCPRCRGTKSLPTQAGKAVLALLDLEERRTLARTRDTSVRLNVRAIGGAHHSSKFAPCIFLGSMPVWEGLPTFDTQGEAVAVAEAKATLVFRRLFADEVPFEFAKNHDDSLMLEALAALEQTEKALAEKSGS